jgi:hypothetical protein
MEDMIKLVFLFFFAMLMRDLSARDEPRKGLAG